MPSLKIQSLLVLLAFGLMGRAAHAQELTIGISGDVDALDPALASSYVSRIVFAGMCDKLFDIDKHLNIVPQLATSYEWTDPKTLTIHLRPGLLFQDGEKMDAAAVKSTLERNLILKGSYRRAEISAIDHIEIVDRLTVRLVLNSPDAPLVAQLADRAGMIVAPETAAAEGASFDSHPVCAGPFAFKERVPQDHITLTRFPGYWDTKDIHFEAVTYRVMSSSSVGLVNLQAGAVDMVDQLAPTDVPTVRGNPKLTVVPSDSLAYGSLVWNVANGPEAEKPTGRDAQVRQAFALGFDRRVLNQVVYNGMFTPEAQAMPTNSPFHIGSIRLPERDAAKARALLNAAGVTIHVPVSLVVRNDANDQQAAEVIQAMEAEAGFAVHISTMEEGGWLQAGQNGRFQLFMLNWSGRADPDGNLYPFLHSAGPYNYGHYRNKTVDHLLEQARAVSVQDLRTALYKQIYQQIALDAPIIYLRNSKNLPGMRKTIVGFKPIPDGLIRLQGLSPDAK
jgi:peptide/nickel transport system substrate-binding protein